MKRDQAEAETLRVSKLESQRAKEEEARQQAERERISRLETSTHFAARAKEEKIALKGQVSAEIFAIYEHLEKVASEISGRHQHAWGPVYAPTLAELKEALEHQKTLVLYAGTNPGKDMFRNLLLLRFFFCNISSADQSHFSISGFHGGRGGYSITVSDFVPGDGYTSGAQYWIYTITEGDITCSHEHREPSNW